MSADRLFDVVVVGAGMVGGATAALLARAGFSVAMIEQREPRPFDPGAAVGLRVSAFSPGSVDVLREAGAWRQIERQRHCAYRRMIVEDRDETTVLQFDAPEFGLDQLGIIIENDLVQWTLWQSLLASGGVEIVCPGSVAALRPGSGECRVELEDGSSLRARLVVGADGAESRIRRMLGIHQDYWEYGQQGIVAVVETATPNCGLAWQRFMEGGPLALLPLQGGASSIVWSRPEPEALRLLELDDEAFLAELRVAAAGSEGHWPDRVTRCGPRAAFPLTMRLSETYTAPNAVLVGDAAHVVHPLAGQGVNLGLLDAAGLVEVLVAARARQDDIAAEKTLLRFGRWRRSEAEIMARGIHNLRGLFMPEELGLLRRLGMGLVARSWTVKEAFIRRATGRHRNAPALARGAALTDLLHP